MNPALVGALKSKTVWVSTLTAAVGIIQTVSPIVPPQYTPIALAASGVLGVVLRALTTQPLSEKAIP